MSGKKRRADAPEGVQGLYSSITDLLIEIKPILSSEKTDDGVTRSVLLVKLQELTNLAESFAEQRPRSNRQWLSQADNLDREGVNLWNTSGILRQRRDQEDLKLFALLRLAAFRLIEAGLEHKPGVETLIHVLQLASKTGSVLSEVGNHDLAGAVLGTAAKFEEALRNVNDPGETHGPAKARAIVVYYTSRMEAAWKEGNDGVAQYMLEKITEDNQQRLPHLSQHDREQLASKLLEIGKSMVRCPSAAEKQDSLPLQDGKRAQEAAKWIKKSFALVEGPGTEKTPAIRELKRAILRNLARVYYFATAADEENLNRAEATLHELTTFINEADQIESEELQQVRWMRLAVLKRKKAADNILLDAFRSIVDGSKLQETELSDVLQELRSTKLNHVLVTQVKHNLIETTLASSDDTSRKFIDQILLALIFHSSRDHDHERAIKSIEIGCDRISEHDEYELPRIPTTACQSLLWQVGDRHYSAKAWSKAADWFLLGAHQAFKSMARTNQARCFRKAALCYIQQQEYALATTILRRCRTDEAPTHYVRFLAAVHQGLEDEAINAIQAMVKAADFDRKMLLLATQLAHDTNLKTVLLAVLDALLGFLQAQGGFETEEDALTMVRCTVRLVTELLKQPVANLNNLIPTLLRQFKTAETIVEAAFKNEVAATLTKDLSWLWRTAYNVAVQGCAEWDESEEHISELFDTARKFMEAYCKSVVTEVDSSVHLHVIYAYFASISGRVLAIRRLCEKSDQTEARRRVCSDIKGFKASLGRMDKCQSQNLADDNRLCSLAHVIYIFETELLCALQDWNSILLVIEEASQSETVTASTFEAIADILWVEKDCPVNVLYAASEAILRTCLNRKCISVEKFSRWLRALCTILLARNTPADRTKAVGYVEQAVHVIEDNNDEESDGTFPIDERQWLLSTSYNTGVECLSASHLDEAKRWFESAMTISRYVPKGEEFAEKISQTYSKLLARYGTRDTTST